MRQLAAHDGPRGFLPRAGLLSFFYAAASQTRHGVLILPTTGAWAVIHTAGRRPGRATGSTRCSASRGAGSQPPGYLPTLSSTFVPWEVVPPPKNLGHVPARRSVPTPRALPFRRRPDPPASGSSRSGARETCSLNASSPPIGLYCGDASGYRDPRGLARLRPGAADWRLLLQVDSQDENRG